MFMIFFLDKVDILILHMTENLLGILIMGLKLIKIIFKILYYSGM